ncbi:hypothetical protein ElyMa_000784800 [Elysia marginata]|uniref:EGF-like domain-containing protein n=1 Tax=Elysia marginata TaxID=1093978 RepID=A0AAV4GVV1_9GAST|nr:hypothetical protein ElyMa_000784800 [Elysia marginata]
MHARMKTVYGEKAVRKWESSYTGTKSDPLEIDYCFGFQLNSCLTPISMDFYLKVPAKKKYVYSTRIKGDRDEEITALSYSLGSLGKIHPMLAFEFEHKPDGNIKYSVVLNVLSSKKTTVDSLSLINEETLHGTECSELIKDTVNEPPKEFTKTECHAKKYGSPSSTSSADYKPSATLSKRCGTSGGWCDPTESCDFSLPRPVCVCLEGPSVTTQEPASAVNGTSGNAGGSSFVKHKLPIVLGCVLSAFVLLALTMWGAIYLRKKRIFRNRLDTALDMQDDSASALLGDTDDMIM